MLRRQFIIFLSLVSVFLPFSHALASQVLSAYKYAWSNEVGYINFENVIVEDDALSGYAWSANSGYINLAPAQGGVLNDGTGNLSGSAWGTGIGWIDFDGVTIDPPVGDTRKFSGTATGANIGTLTFDCGFCDVRIPVTVTPPPAPPAGEVPFETSEPSSNIPSTNASPIVAVTEENGGPIEQPPLFDVISEPVQSTGKSSLLWLVLSIIGGVLIAYLFIMYGVVRPRVRIAYYNGTETAGMEQNMEKIIKKQFRNFKTVTLSDASKTDYQGTTVINVSGKHDKEAKKIAKFLNGIVAPMPIGEIQPDADILIISGKQ